MSHQGAIKTFLGSRHLVRLHLLWFVCCCRMRMEKASQTRRYRRRPTPSCLPVRLVLNSLSLRYSLFQTLRKVESHFFPTRSRHNSQCDLLDAVQPSAPCPLPGAVQAGSDGSDARTRWTWTRVVRVSPIRTCRTPVSSYASTCVPLCLCIKGRSVQPQLHHHVHQREPSTPLPCSGRHQEIHPGHGAAGGAHSSRGWDGRTSETDVWKPSFADCVCVNFPEMKSEDKFNSASLFVLVNVPQVPSVWSVSMEPTTTQQSGRTHMWEMNRTLFSPSFTSVMFNPCVWFPLSGV